MVNDPETGVMGTGVDVGVAIVCTTTIGVGVGVAITIRGQLQVYSEIHWAFRQRLTPSTLAHTSPLWQSLSLPQEASHTLGALVGVGVFVDVGVGVVVGVRVGVGELVGVGVGVWVGVAVAVGVDVGVPLTILVGVRVILGRHSQCPHSSSVDGIHLHPISKQPRFNGASGGHSIGPPPNPAFEAKFATCVLCMA